MILGKDNLAWLHLALLIHEKEKQQPLCEGQSGDPLVMEVMEREALGGYICILEARSHGTLITAEETPTQEGRWGGGSHPPPSWSGDALQASPASP